MSMSEICLAIILEIAQASALANSSKNGSSAGIAGLKVNTTTPLKEISKPHSCRFDNDSLKISTPNRVAIGVPICSRIAPVPASAMVKPKNISEKCSVEKVKENNNIQRKLRIFNRTNGSSSAATMTSRSAVIINGGNSTTPNLTAMTLPPQIVTVSRASSKSWINIKEL